MCVLKKTKRREGTEEMLDVIGNCSRDWQFIEEAGRKGGRDVKNLCIILRGGKRGLIAPDEKNTCACARTAIFIIPTRHLGLKRARKHHAIGLSDQQNK